MKPERCLLVGGVKWKYKSVSGPLESEGEICLTFHPNNVAGSYKSTD